MCQVLILDPGVQMVNKEGKVLSVMRHMFSWENRH